VNSDLVWGNEVDAAGDEGLSVQERLRNSQVVVHTTLDMNLQLEIGKATHSRAIRFVALAFVLIVVGYNIVNFLIMKDNVVLLSAISLGPCVILFIFAFWIYNPVTMVRSIRQFKKHGRWPEYLICFSDHGFETCSAISGRTYEHSYSDISRIKETPGLILLICQTTVVALAKDRFAKGTCSELNELIRSSRSVTDKEKP
jgi:hypothetical protein